jgi:Ca2+-binding RTX toxin-like protein
MSGTTPAPLNRVLGTQSVRREDGRRDVSIVVTDGNQTTTLAYLGTFTEAEAPVLRDLVLDPTSATPRALFIVQTGSAAAGTLQSNIWQTDGTAAGTEAWGTVGGQDISLLAPDSLVRFGDRLAFTALVVAPDYSSDPAWEGVRRLWVIEEDGTARIHPITTPTTSDDGSKVGYGNPTGLIAVGDDLYFAANGGFPHGRELYAIEGDAPSGSLARLVKDVAPFSFDTPAPPQWYEEAAAFALRLFEGLSAIVNWYKTIIPLSAIDVYQFALELIKKAAYAVLYATGVAQDVQRYLEEQLFPDGTDPAPLAAAILAQTRQILEDGNGDYFANGLPFPDFLTPVGDGMVFRGSTPVFSRYEPELWFSDGTTAGTAPLRTEAGEVIRDPSNFMQLPDNRLLFMAQHPAGSLLYVTDGTAAGTFPVAGGVQLPYSLDKPSSVIIGNRVVFAALGPGGEGFELWASDGTVTGRLLNNWNGRDNFYWEPRSGQQGIRLLKDIAPGEASSLPAEFVAIAGGALFTAGDETRQVWFTDGTPEGTRLALPEEIQLRPLGLISVTDNVAPNTLGNPAPAFSNAAGMMLSGSTDALDASTVRISLFSPGLESQFVTKPVVGGRWSHDFASLAEGEYSAFIRATDLNGNEDQSPAIIRFKMDRTPPETSVTAPPPALTNQARPVISGTADPDAVKVTLTLSASGLWDPQDPTRVWTLEAPVVNGQWSATLPTLIASRERGREFEWSVVATDAAGNTDPTPVTGGFTLDLVAPDTTVSAGGATRSTRGLLQVGVTNSDQVAGGGITLRIERPDGSIVTEEFGSFFLHTRLIAAPMDGTYTFTATARDLAGNADATPAVTTFTVSRPVDWQILWNDDFAPDTGMAGVGGVVGAGLLRVSGSATDDPRSPSGVQTVLLRVTDADNSLNPANVTIPATVTGTSWQADLDLSGFAHGTRVRFDANAVDRAGNVDRSSAFGGTTTIDRLAPEASVTTAGISAGQISGSTPGHTDAVEIRLRLTSPTGEVILANVTPDNTGIKNGVWSYTVANPADGAWTVVAQAVDHVGNADQTPTEAVVTMDGLPPETFVAPPNASLYGFALSGSPDAVSFRYTLTGGPSGVGFPVTILGSTAQILPSGPGFWRLEAAAIDAAGNTDPTPIITTLSMPGGTVIDSASASGLIEGRANFATEVILTLQAPDGQVFTQTVPTTGSLASGRSWSYAITEDQGGTWSITARGVSAAGHLDPTPATVSAYLEPVPDTAVTPLVFAPRFLNTASVQLTGTATPFVARTVELLLTGPNGASVTTSAQVTTAGTWNTTFSPSQDGVWTVSAAARNVYGEADATPAVASFRVDLTPPETALAALPAFTTSRDLLLTGTASTDATQVRISATGLADQLVAVVNGAWSATIVNPADGAITIQARARDAAGNEDATPAQATTSMDRSAPETLINALPALIGNTTNVTISGATSGNAAAVDLILTRPDGTSFTALASGTANWSFTLTSPVDGLWQVSAAARDLAGNRDLTPDVTAFTVDRTAPGLSFNAYPTISNIATQSFSGTTASDAVSVTLEFSGGPGGTRSITAPVTAGVWAATLTDLPDGGWNIAGRALDAAGNLGNSVAAPRLVLDRTAPETVVLQDFPSRVIPAATNAASINVVGAFETSSTSESWVVIALTGPDGTVSETIVTRGTTTQYQRTLSLPTEGIWQLAVTERDTAGNADPTPFLRNILVDRTGPNASIVPVANNNGNFVLSGTADADAVSVTITGLGSAVTLPVLGGQWSLAYAGQATGAKQVFVTARDALGNADATPATASFTVDATAPISRLLSINGMSSIGLEALATNRDALTFTGNAASDAAWVQFDLLEPDGETLTVTAPVVGGTWSIAVPLTEEGTWRVLGGTAVDGFGNRGLAMVLPAQTSFLVDRTAPDTIFSAPVAAFNPSVIPATGVDTGAGHRGVTLEFTRPDGVVVTNPSSLHDLYRFADGFTRDGLWIVRAFAEDRAGNRDDTPAVASFIVDGTKPVTTIDPGVPPVSAATLLSFAGSSSTDGVLAELTYTGGGPGFTVNVPVTDGRWSHDFIPPSEGRWFLSVRTQDEAGNWSNPVEARAAGFAIDRAAPETSLFALPTTAGSSITLSGLVGWSTAGAGSFDVAAKREASLVRLTLTGPNDTVITRDLFPREVLRVDGVEYGNGWRAVLDVLTPGNWQFSAATMNNNGVLDPTPVTGSFIIDRSTPDTTINGTGQISTPLTSVTLTGTATAGYATQVRLTLYPDGYGPREVLAPVDLDGNWSVTLTNLLTNRNTAVSVQALERGGIADPTPAQFLIVQDQVAPDTRIVTPAVDAHVKTAGLEVAGNVNTPDATRVSVTFTHTSGATVTQEIALTSDGQWFASLADAAEGAWTVTAAARDAAGNVDATPASRIITVDRTAPDTFITPVTGVVNAPYAVLTGALSAGEAGSVALSIERPDGTILNVNASAANGSWSYTLPTLLDGVYRVTATASDRAGNVDATPATADVTVLYERPDATVSIPDPWRSNSYNTTIEVSSLVVRLHAVLTSPDGAVRSTNPLLGGPSGTFSNLIPEGPDGIWTLTVTAEDIYGTRDATPAIVLLRVDRTPPETAISSAAWVVADGAARITGTASEDATFITYYLTPPGGTTPATNAGGWSSMVPGEGGNWSLGFADLAEGSWRLTAYASDGASQRDATPATTTFVVDRTAPDTTLAALPGLTNNPLIQARGTVIGSDAVTVDLTATGPGGAILSTTVAVVEGGWSWSFTATGDGAWSIAARARDAAGNLDASAAAGSFTLDTTPPAAPSAFTQLASDSFYQNQIGVVVPSDPDVARYFYTFTTPAGVATTTSSIFPNGGYAVPEDAPDGTFLVSVRTQDAAGNISVGALSGSITLDRTPPVLSAVTTTWLPDSRELEFSGTADTASVQLFLRAIQYRDAEDRFWPTIDLQPVITVTAGAWSYRVAEAGDRPWDYFLRATDSFGRQTSISTLTVTPDTTRPDTALNALPAIAPDAPLNVTGTATLNDATVVALLATGPGGATVTAEVAVTNGNWAWEFSAPARGVWTITATARDAAGNRDATPATAQVDIANFPSITSGAAASFAENDTGIAYQALGTDWDGGAITWSLGGADASRFTVDAAGAVRFAAAPDFEAPADQGSNNGYDILVIATGEERSLTRAVTISVTDVNDVAPLITSGATASFAENDTGVAYAATGSDAEGATLSWSLGGVDAGRFTIGADGAVRFATAPDFESPADADGDNAYRIEVIASDGALSSTRAVTITVANVNDVAPLITSGATASFAENDTGVAYAATGSDAEGATLTWTLGGADAGLFTIGADGAVRFATAPDFEAPADADGDNAYRIEVIASDGALSSTRAVTITVTNVNDVAPVITSGEVASFVESDTGVAYVATGSDAEGASLTWSLGGADAGRFTIGADGAVRFATAPDFESPTDADGDNAYRIEVIASDGALSSTRAVTITVTDVNDAAPLITSGATASFAENDTGVAYAATGSDAEGATLTWSLGGADAGLFTIDADGAVRFATAPDFEAPADADGDNAYRLDVIASDGVLSTTRAVTITVTNVNEMSPAITSAASAAFGENGSGVAYRATASDGDGNTLSWSLAGLDAALFTINAAGEVRFRAAPDFEAPADAGLDNGYEFTVIASDGLFTASRDVTVTVTDGNDRAPVITAPASLSVAENSAGIILQAEATDPEGGSIAWSLAGADAARFTVDASGALRFAPAPDFEAPGDADRDNLYQVTLLASDGDLTTSQALTITVTDLDDIPPVITSPAAMRFLENGTGIVHLARGTDAAGRPITWSISGTDAGLFTIDATGALRFAATPDFEAPADANTDNRYDLVLSGTAGGAVATQALSITVVNQDEAPVMTAHPSVGYIENLVTLAFQGGAYDPEGAALTWSLAGEDAARFRLDPQTGGLRFISTPNFEAPLDAGADGAFNVWLTASDGIFATTSDVWIYLSDDQVEGNAVAPGDLSGFRPLDGNFFGRMLGRSSADIMYGGTHSDDTLVGLAGNDFFDGGTVNYFNRTVDGPAFGPSGDDLFDPGAGNDTFVGGDGTDSVVYRQNAVTGTTPTVALVSGTTFTVTETAGTTDTLTDVEFAYFNNGVWNLTTNQFTAYGLTLTAATSQAEGGAGAVTPYNFTLTRSGFLSSAQEFAWRVDVGTASAADFAGGALPWGTVSFAANQASVVIPVLLAGDALDEGNETFTLRIFREIGGASGVSMDLVSRNGTIANGGAAPATLSITSGTSSAFTEGGTGIAYLASAAYSVAGTTLNWSLAGVDGALFTIDSMGALRFRDAPSFRSPLDAGVDNVYDVNVIATGGGVTATKAIAVTVARANLPPSITSGVAASFAESSTGTVYAATAVDPDGDTPLNWILGGADADLFEVSAAGAVTFKTAPDFEAPADAGGDNVYDITIAVSDGALSSAARAVTITVTNVNEAPRILSPAAVSFAENGAGAAYQGLAVDPDAGTTLTWSLAGPDAALFVISGDGVVRFNAAPNFEAPADAGRDNVYDLRVIASDGALTAGLDIAITVTDVAEAVRLTGGGGADRLTGSALGDRLAGGAGPDTLLGGAGNDTLDGGLGADRMEGGADSDSYVVDDAGDVVIELAGGGYDRVTATITHTLADEVERLSLWGSANLNGTGNALANRLDGNAGANRLDGGEGNDVLYGLVGSDTLLGGAGADLLDGGSGGDRMEGGADNDNYVVDDAGDVIIELPGGGNDRVVATITHALAGEVEWLSLFGMADLDGTGNALANRLDGNAGANRLDGGEGNDAIFGLVGDDRLIGGVGNDTLDGGLGADRMEGGADNDSYVVDDAGDVVIELPGGGNDRVVATITHTLADEVERLNLFGTADLDGTGNALANRLDGNAGANRLDGREGNDALYGLVGSDTLLGGAGADLLDGGLGADRMEGGADNDNYVVDDAGDVVIEGTGGGYDRVVATITHALTGEVERLSLFGTADLDGTGNALANRLDGNAGANRLDGGEGDDALFGLMGDDSLSGDLGNDLLDGGLGADILAGGLGADRFLFRSAVEAHGDVISDFSVAEGDRIDLRPIDTNAGLAGDQGFTWIGDAGFGGVAGQLRFAIEMLEGDLDGNGVADFQITLSGVAPLSAANIWL